jgi:integrase
VLAPERLRCLLCALRTLPGRADAMAEVDHLRLGGRELLAALPRQLLVLGRVGVRELASGVLDRHPSGFQGGLERDFAADAYEDRDLVFCDELGGPINPQRLSHRFAALRVEAGLPAGSLHTLRHTAATLALTSEVPVHIVAARLGDRPEQILSTYSHLLPRSDEIAAERVAAAIG